MAQMSHHSTRRKTKEKYDIDYIVTSNGTHTENLFYPHN